MFIRSRAGCRSLLLLALALLSSAGGASFPGAGAAPSAELEAAGAAACTVEQAPAAEAPRTGAPMQGKDNGR